MLLVGVEIEWREGRCCVSVKKISIEACPAFWGEMRA
jgi:hypothetical protein